MVKPQTKPHILHFQHIGAIETGFIDVADFEKTIPFTVKRAFWVYQTPESYTRGNHAHYETELVLISVAGSILVTTETPEGKVDFYTLNSPREAIYLPPYVWRTMQYSSNAIQLAFASAAYTESDYIRDYKQFKELCS